MPRVTVESAQGGPEESHTYVVMRRGVPVGRVEYDHGLWTAYLHAGESDAEHWDVRELGTFQNWADATEAVQRAAGAGYDMRAA